MKKLFPHWGPLQFRSLHSKGDKMKGQKGGVRRPSAHLEKDTEPPTPARSFLPHRRAGRHRSRPESHVQKPPCPRAALLKAGDPRARPTSGFFFASLTSSLLSVLPGRGGRPAAVCRLLTRWPARCGARLWGLSIVERALSGPASWGVLLGHGRSRRPLQGEVDPKPPRPQASPGLSRNAHPGQVSGDPEVW